MTLVSRPPLGPIEKLTSNDSKFSTKIPELKADNNTKAGLILFANLLNKLLQPKLSILAAF